MTGQVKLLQVKLSYDMLSHFGIGQVRQVKFENFWTKILLGLHFFLAKILLTPKFCWTQNIFGLKMLLDQKFLNLQFFDQNALENGV